MNKNLSLVSNKIQELPNNIEAEQAVIGSVLTSNEIFDDITQLFLKIIFMTHYTKKFIQRLIT